MYVNDDPTKVQMQSACPHGAYTADCGCEPVHNRAGQIVWIPRDGGEPTRYRPESAVLYDGTPGSGSLPRRAPVADDWEPDDLRWQAHPDDIRAERLREACDL